VPERICHDRTRIAPKGDDITDSAADNSTPRYFIQSLDKGLKLLQTFSRERPAMTLTELATVLGLPKAGTQRLVRTLVDLDFLQRLPGKRYGLGVMALDLGHRYLSTLNIPVVAEPFMQELVQKTQETVNLAIRSGREVVYVARIAAAPRIVSVNLEVGSRLPVHATALGKALLIDMTRDELALLLGAEPWSAYTPHTKTTVATLAEDLSHARQEGIALNDGELELGLRSIAAPIRDLSGQIVAALNVSTNSFRVPMELIRGPMRDALLYTADRISQALGYPGSRTQA
jgi:IclR family pca regulon transcriptional regulator